MDSNEEIKTLLRRYEAALNASDTAQVLPLYTNDGVFMPTEAPTAQNLTIPEENRELFVFKKESGAWKIARYMFNKSKPSK